MAEDKEQVHIEIKIDVESAEEVSESKFKKDLDKVILTGILSVPRPRLDTFLFFLAVGFLLVFRGFPPT